MKFHGPSYGLADTIVKAFEIYVTKLIYFTNSNSTVLASSSTAMLESLCKVKLGTSGLVIIKRFDEALPVVMEDFTEIVNKLSPVIGELTCHVNKVLKDLGCTLKHYMSEFITCGIDGCINQVDYKPVYRRSSSIYEYNSYHRRDFAQRI